MRSSASTHGAPRTSEGDEAVTVTPEPLRVTTAAESARRDADAINARGDSFPLMMAAGTRATEMMLRECGHRMARGVEIFAGPGNNGGDAWIVAAQLHRSGVNVRVVSPIPPRSPDARRAAALAADRGVIVTSEVTQDAARESARESAHDATAALVVDGLLGTGQEGALRPPIAGACTAIAAARARGATVVSLDIPTGVNATTGDAAAGHVEAHITATFGTIKRGLLVNRGAAGRITLLDIGLGEYANGTDHAWQWAHGALLAALLPRSAWNDHKGRRGQLLLMGGTAGMAGATVLAARAALASGIGLARVRVEEPGVSVLQQAVPQAIAESWSTKQDPVVGVSALAIGPGLGRTPASGAVLRAVLEQYPGVPTLLDADALTLLATGADVPAWSAGQPVVFTPHPGEFARLQGGPVADDWEERAEQCAALATRLGVTVLLKGAPTLVASPSDGAGGNPLWVVPHGSPVLATGGSGDMLTGIIGTLLAQGLGAREAAVLGATVHGFAAELAAPHGVTVRGVTLGNVIAALPMAWRAIAEPATRPPGVLAILPAV